MIERKLTKCSDRKLKLGHRLQVAAKPGYKYENTLLYNFKRKLKTNNAFLFDIFYFFS